MNRFVTCDMALTTQSPTDVVMAITVSDEFSRDESLSVTNATGEAVDWAEYADANTRLQQFSMNGEVTVSYACTVHDSPELAPTLPQDLTAYRRQSRYAQSDRLLGTAQRLFGSLTGPELVLAVRDWVASELTYVAGSTGPSDSALESLVTRAGVCRDHAHLVIALLRARDVPARFVACYAPGLNPMEFHAIAEAHVDGAWWAVDASAMAPRQSLVRVATGRDAADTAFLTSHGSPLTLTNYAVTATYSGDLPIDNHDDLKRLG